jgi:dihydroorotase
MVDTHVHFMDPGDTSREDFPTGTSAAACAGVTTIIEHTHAAPVRSAAELAEKRGHLKGRAAVDFGLAAHAWPASLNEAEEVWRAGAAYFKAFTCTTHGVPGHDAAHLLELFRTTVRLSAPVLVHCEDESITGYWEAELKRLGRDDGAVICEWRNRDAEATATAVTALLARRSGAHVVVAHASSPEVLRLVDRERREGARILVETCPQYLLLLEQELLEFGPLRKFTPPARARGPADLAEMWSAVASGGVHHLSSDHAPSTRPQKESGSIWDVHFGLPGIDTTFAALLRGAAEGTLSYERVAEVYSEAPAKAYGLWPRKGSLNIGADADVVLVDATRRWRLADDQVISKAAWSPYSGSEFIGQAVATFLRGRLVASERTVVEAELGQFVPGAGATPASLDH